jgi:collagenase-like PrtC family protease
MIPLLKGYVNEIYFQVPKKIMGSGRVIFEEKDYEDRIKKIIIACKKSRISSNLLLNATCEGEDNGSKRYADSIISYLKKLKKTGLDSVSVTNPIHIQRIKKEVPNLVIHSSVNCYVKNSEHAKYLKYLGVDVITIDRDINRDIKLIRKIKKDTGAKIKVVLNEGCLKNCPYRQSHFNMISHNRDTDYFDETSCVNIYRKFPEKIFSIPFIRPEDLKKYDGAVDFYKISTRTMSTEKIPVILNAYIEEKYDGDLLMLLSTKGLFDHFKNIDNMILNNEGFSNKLWACDNECEKCDYCKRLLKKAVKIVK